MKKRIALCLVALVPFVCPAPYQLTWQPQFAPDVTIIGYRIYTSTNSLTDYNTGKDIKWNLVSECGGVYTTNYTLFIDPGTLSIGISQLTTNGEGMKFVLPLIPPPTNAFYKSVP